MLLQSVRLCLPGTRGHPWGLLKLAPEYFLLKICDFGIIYTSVIISHQALNSCVILDKVLNLSGPHFFHLLNKDDNITVGY